MIYFNPFLQFTYILPSNFQSSPYRKIAKWGHIDLIFFRPDRTHLCKSYTKFHSNRINFVAESFQKAKSLPETRSNFEVIYTYILSFYMIQISWKASLKLVSLKNQNFKIMKNTFYMLCNFTRRWYVVNFKMIWEELTSEMAKRWFSQIWPPVSHFECCIMGSYTRNTLRITPICHINFIMIPQAIQKLYCEYEITNYWIMRQLKIILKKLIKKKP